MPKLRISIVEYLNTAPLVWSFTDGPLQGKYELQFAVPSRCAEALRSGAADIGIIPAVEYQRMDDVVIFPEMGVSAKGTVRSILVLAKKPIEEVRRLALDVSSRSSQALVRILCRRHWKIQPEFVPARPEPSEMLREADAALLIGDPALRLMVAYEAAGGRAGQGGCAAAKRGPLVSSVPEMFLYDVAQEWRALTGLPCVLAIWVAQRQAAQPEVVADFLASKSYGLKRLREIAECAAPKLNLPAAELERYLRDNIDFSLDEENRAGLALYYRFCAEDGLIPAARPMEWAAIGSAAGRR